MRVAAGVALALDEGGWIGDRDDEAWREASRKHGHDFPWVWESKDRRFYGNLLGFGAWRPAVLMGFQGPQEEWDRYIKRTRRERRVTHGYWDLDYDRDKWIHYRLSGVYGGTRNYQGHDCDAPAWTIIPALVVTFWRVLLLAILVVVLLVLSAVVLGEGSASGATAVRAVPYGRDGGERLSAPVVATIEDGSAAALIDGRSRSLSSAIRISHGSPVTQPSVYEAVVRPEPQAWPTTRWTCLEIAEAAARQGFTDTVTVAAIAVAESGGRSDALAVTPRERSVGPLQINMRAHPSYSESCLRSLSCSLSAAWKISVRGTNFNPWTVYRNGTYEGRC